MMTAHGGADGNWSPEITADSGEERKKKKRKKNVS